jgi:hypothetical protein
MRVGAWSGADQRSCCIKYKFRYDTTEYLSTWPRRTLWETILLAIENDKFSRFSMKAKIEPTRSISEVSGSALVRIGPFLLRLSTSAWLFSALRGIASRQLPPGRR